MFIDIIKVFTL